MATLIFIFLRKLKIETFKITSKIHFIVSILTFEATLKGGLINYPIIEELLMENQHNFTKTKSEPTFFYQFILLRDHYNIQKVQIPLKGSLHNHHITMHECATLHLLSIPKQLQGVGVHINPTEDKGYHPYYPYRNYSHMVSTLQGVCVPSWMFNIKPNIALGFMHVPPIVFVAFHIGA
ncbi:hypothetical protein ACJX0J_016766 [Zea mays]